MVVICRSMDALWERFPAVGARAVEVVDHQVVAEVSREELVRAVRVAVEELGARFVISVATDMRDAGGVFRVSNVLAFDADRDFLVLETPVPADDPRLPSLTPQVPAAGWAEREMQDLLGIQAVGHPDPRRLALSDDFPPGVHPLRREVRYDARFPYEPENAPGRTAAPAGSTVMPMGPFYPTLEEPACFRLFVDGERVVDADYRGFYNHRAVEKLADSALNYNQVPFMAQQICGICGQVHSCAYCEAVERAAGIEVPERALYIRTLLLELERLHSHLLWVGLAGHILGFDTLLMQAWRIREPLMWLMERLTGNRKHYSSNLVGGVRMDVDADGAADIRRILDKVEAEYLEVVRAVSVDDSLMARLKDVGVLTEADARALGTVGPVARASGVRIDARVDHPYAAYARLAPRPVFLEGGDCWARTLVRVQEVLESLRLVRAALDDMPGGPVMAAIDGALPEGRVGLCSVEAARGEAHHYVLTGPENRPRRWRVRAPTYPNLQAVRPMIRGMQLADVPICLGSYDPCFSCTERVETLDVSSNRVRTYTRQELTAISRRARRRPGAREGGP